MLEIYLRFDTFVSKRCMNPLFTWVQTWLHCNRFQLIILFMKLSIGAIISFIVLAFVTLGLYYVCMWSVTLYSFHKQYAHVHPLLEEASKAIEHDPPKHLSLRMKNLIAVRREMRRSWVGFASWIILAIMIPNPSPPFSALFVVFSTFQIFLDHLYDVNDVSPSERQTLFEPNSQTQT